MRLISERIASGTNSVQMADGWIDDTAEQNAIQFLKCAKSNRNTALLTDRRKSAMTGDIKI